MADEKKIDRELINRLTGSASHFLRKHPSNLSSPGAREKYEKQYDTLKAMPAEVLANRVVAAIRHSPIIEWVGIVATFVEQMRAEYREEGEIEDQHCKDCDAVTTHRVEKLVGIGQPGDFILRCTICGKVKL
jgi:hypothetical protein